MVDLRQCYTVYAIRHNPTGKIYVGSTEYLEHRLKEHITALKRGKHHSKGMQKDFDECGGDYSFCILETPKLWPCGYRLERVYMTAFRSRDPERGYNDNDRSTDQSSLKHEWFPLPLNQKQITDPRKEWYNQ